MTLRLKAILAVAAGFAAGALGAFALTFALPVSADVRAEGWPAVLGDGVTAACDTNPVTIDDTDVDNDQPWRWVVCKNDSANTVRFSYGNGTQGGAPTTTTPGTDAGGVWAAVVPAAATVKCYAASASNVQCQEGGALP